MMAFATLAMVSCKKESLQYDGPVLAHFSSEKGAYFVDEAGEEFSIPVGITKPSGDVTVTIKVNTDKSTAVEGEDFTIETKEITIKAGEVLSDLIIKGNFENLDEPKKIVLEIESSDNTAQYNQTYTLSIQRFCPFVRDDFIGVYLFESEWWEDSYEVEAIADPEDENAIIFLDLYEPGFNIKVVFNASDKSSFVTSVAKQDAWIYPGLGTIFLAGGSGKFSACDKTLSYETKHGLPDGRFFVGVELALFTKLD